MKSNKLIVLLMSFAIAAITPMFTSCSSDDNNEEENNGDIAVMAKDMNSTPNLVDFIIIFVLSYT